MTCFPRSTSSRCVIFNWNGIKLHPIVVKWKCVSKLSIALFSGQRWRVSEFENWVLRVTHKIINTYGSISEPSKIYKWVAGFCRTAHMKNMPINFECNFPSMDLLWHHTAALPGSHPNPQTSGIEKKKRRRRKNKRPVTRQLSLEVAH